MQVLIGLGFVTALYVVAKAGELVSLYFILDKFLVYFVLAVIILFQQDIRRALARAGGKFFPTSSVQSDVSLHEELIKACFTLASRRIGALVALEREASLDEYVEPATRVDAHVTHELLQSIFHPTSPLHDGAVVVRDGKLAAAQVFLPLSLSKNMSRFFGTRHRAALGLTEETDAVVIIVSEERGAVSIANGGHLRPCADANELREQIQELFHKVPTKQATPAEPSEA